MNFIFQVLTLSKPDARMKNENIGGCITVPRSLLSPHSQRTEG